MTSEERSEMQSAVKTKCSNFETDDSSSSTNKPNLSSILIGMQNALDDIVRHQRTNEKAIKELQNLQEGIQTNVNDIYNKLNFLQLNRNDQRESAKETASSIIRNEDMEERLSIQYEKGSTNADIKHYSHLVKKSFMLSDDVVSKREKFFNSDTVRLMKSYDRVLAGVTVLDSHLWLGKRQVPVSCITNFCVSIDDRNTGVSKMMLTHLLKELYDKRIGFSILFPVTKVPYSNVGFEIAGRIYDWKLSLNSIVLPKDGAQKKCTMIEIDFDKEEDMALIKKLHSLKNQSTDGSLDRPDYIWDDNVFNLEEDETIYGYFMQEKDPMGYIIYSQSDECDDGEEGRSLIIKDFVCLSPSCYSKIIHLLHTHRSIADFATWQGPYNEPMLIYLRDCKAEIESCVYWMGRIISLKDALENRGYSKQLDMELSFSYEDNIIEENNKNFTLKIQNGQGKVSVSSSSNLKISSSAFPALYTGYLSATELRKLRLIEGSDDDIDKAQLIFAHNSSSFIDEF